MKKYNKSKSARRDEKRKSYRDSIVERLNGMKREIDKTWTKEEIRGTVSLMLKFTNDQETFYLAVPEDTDNPLGYITGEPSKTHRDAAIELRHLLK